MDLSALRTLTLEVDGEFHGVAATVTLSDQPPISTTVIWEAQLPNTDPLIAQDLMRRDPRRRARLRRDHVPSVARGITVTCPEAPGGDSKIWEIDGLPEPIDQYYWRVFLTLART